MSLDFVKMFDGLTEEQARQKAALLRAAFTYTNDRRTNTMSDNNLSDVPEDVRKKIIQDALNEASNKLQAEQQKGTQQREVEKLNAELGQLSDSMKLHFKEPTRYRNELHAEQKRQDEILSRLRELGAEKPSDPAAAAGITVHSSKRYYFGVDGTLKEA